MIRDQLVPNIYINIHIIANMSGRNSRPNQKCQNTKKQYLNFKNTITVSRQEKAPGVMCHVNDLFFLCKLLYYLCIYYNFIKYIYYSMHDSYSKSA